MLKMVTDLLNAGVDIAAIQYMLGDSRIKTVMHYAELSSQRARIDYYQSMAEHMQTKGGLAS
jgi:site-specific recombinase XerD